MENQVRVPLRMPPRIIRQIRQVAKAEGSTISQFIRTAAIEKLGRARRAA